MVLAQVALALVHLFGSSSRLADAGDATTPITEWVQLVNLPLSMLILYGFARGWFITGKEHQRVVEERNQERNERIEAQKALTDQALPLMRENEHTMSDLVKAVERLEAHRGRG